MPRLTADAACGRMIQPCEQDARWHRHAFTIMDRGKELVVSAGASAFEMSIDGVLRTESDADLVGNSWSAGAAAVTYRVCDLEEYIGGALWLGVGDPTPVPVAVTVRSLLGTVSLGRIGLC